MTHAECRELLVDLLCGELAPARAAEVELHLAGCAACAQARAELAQARGAFAALLSPAALEEPGPLFDGPILAAAREAAARMASAGTSAGSSGAAPALQLLPGGAAPAAREASPAARDDKMRRRPQPRWMRAALVGSIAAAAALALIVSSGRSDRALGVPPRAADELIDSAQRGALAGESAQRQAAGPGAPAARPAEPGEKGAAADELRRKSLRALGGHEEPSGPPAAAEPAEGKQADLPGAPPLEQAPRGAGAPAPHAAATAVEQRAFAPPPPGWGAGAAAKKSPAPKGEMGAGDGPEASAQLGGDGSPGAIGGSMSAGAPARRSEPQKPQSRGAGAVDKAAQPAADAQLSRGDDRARAAADGEGADEKEKRKDAPAPASPAPAAASAPASAATPPAPAAPVSALEAPAPALAPAPPQPSGAAEEKSAPAPKQLRLAEVARGPASSADSAAGAGAATEESAAARGPALESRASAQRARGQPARAAQLYRDAAEDRFSAGQDAEAARDLARAVACLAEAGRLDEARALRDQLAARAPAQRRALEEADAALARARPAPAAP